MTGESSRRPTVKSWTESEWLRSASGFKRSAKRMAEGVWFCFAGKTFESLGNGATARCLRSGRRERLERQLWSSKRGPNLGCQVQEYCNCHCADGYLDRKLIDGTGRFVYHQNRLGSSRQAPWRRGSCYRHHGAYEGSSLRLYTWSYDSMAAGLESTGSTWRKVVFSIDWPQGKPPL